MLRNVSVGEAIASFVRIAPVAPKRIAVSTAIGLRLAEDVTVRRPQPAAPLAACNGYAVAAASLAGASARRPRLLGQDVHLIESGSVLPCGTDAVLPFAHVTFRLKGPSAICAVRSGEGVVAPEAVAAPGTVLATAGTRLSFAVAMACVSCSVTDVLVRRPVVDIIFNSPGMPVPCDQLVGLIVAAIRRSGSEIGSIGRTGGDLGQLREAMLCSSADAIVVIGGVGDGQGDTTMAAVAEAGEVVFHGVRMDPGGSFGFGIVAGKPVFASPGSLAGMMAANIVLSPHFARRAFGSPPGEPQLVHAALTAAIPASPGRSRLIIARREDGRVTPFLDEKPCARLLAQANASIFLPEGARHFRRGQIVAMLRMGATS